MELLAQTVKEQINRNAIRCTVQEVIAFLTAKGVTEPFDMAKVFGRDALQSAAVQFRQHKLGW